MQKVVPMDRVPNMQAFPESGYPVAAYYGVDTTLANMQAGSASAHSAGATAPSAMAPHQRVRLLLTILGFIFIAYFIFHWYNK